MLSPSVTLAENSDTKWTIIPEGQGLDFAADELARYLAIITGAHFPIANEGEPPPDKAIHLRICPAFEESHGWEIRPYEIILFGHEPLSLLHAVYHFLEVHGGCRWLCAFDGEEIVPRRTTLNVPLEKQCFRPDFAQRAFTNYPAIDQRTILMADWMAKQRFNRFMIFANVEGAFAAYEHELERQLTARGLHVELGHHSCRFFVPPKEFFASHPEYFALIHEERRPDGQLCLSNPEVVQLVAERICQLFAAHPEIDTIGLWPNDGFGWCECPQCLAQEPSQPSLLWPDQPRRTDTYLRFVTAVAERVAEAYPERFLSALAYLNYVEPPRTVALPPQIKIYFAPFQRCFRHPIGGAADCCRPNAQYAALLEEWRQVVPGPLYVFEYLMLIDMLSLPYPLYERIAEDLAFYRELGVEGYVLEYRPEEWGLYGPQAYLLGQLSWDTGANLTTLLRALQADLYGPAAEEIGAFWESFQDRFVPLAGCVHHYNIAHARRATRKLLQPALAHLGWAIAHAASGERRHRAAVQRLQIGVQWLLHVGRWQEFVQQARIKKQWLPDAEAAAEELLSFVERHAESGTLFAPGLRERIQREQAALRAHWERSFHGEGE